MERRILQAVVAIGGLVPVTAGAAGIFLGSGVFGLAGDLSGDSQFRYLSGLLLGIGLAFWSAIPRIENRSGRFLLLTVIVVTGGCGRLFAILWVGAPNAVSLFGLTMELAVTPTLCLWQRRIAARGAIRAAKEAPVGAYAGLTSL